MKLSTQQLKAIEWFCKTRNLRPELSTPPSEMRFTNKITGESVKSTLNGILLLYSASERQRKVSS